MKNLFIILFALIWTVTHIDDSKAQTTVWKMDMVKQKISGGDSLSYVVDNAYIPNPNLSTYEFVLRDPVSGYRSTVTRATLFSSPTFTGTVTVPTPATSGSATNKGYVDAAIAAIPTPSYSYQQTNFAGSTTATQISTTKEAYVQYAYDATVTISLLAGQSVTAILEYADNSGMSANLVTLDAAVTSNSGVLNLTQTNTLKVTGFVPPAKYRRVRFVTAGTGVTAPSVLKSSQERY